MVIVDSARLIVGGVDTHRDVNVAAVVDMNGGVLGVESFATTADGHRRLGSWMSGFGTIERVGIEGTGSYGAGVARFFMRASVVVIEVDRPDRQKRRRRGKSDQLDAVEAARGALSGRCAGRPKSGDAHAEALRALLVAKRSARSTRIATIVQLRHLMFTAPDDLRARLGSLTATQLVNEAARLRPRPGADVAVHGVKTAAVILAATCPCARCRARVDRRADHTARQSCCTRPVEPVRCRRGYRGGAARDRWRQPRTDRVRSEVGDAVRDRADPGHERSQGRPVPTQLRR